MLHSIEKNICLLNELFWDLDEDEKREIMAVLWKRTTSLLVGASGSIEKNIIKCKNYMIPLETIIKSPTGILEPTGDVYINIDHLIELGSDYEEYFMRYPSITHRKQSYINKLIYLVKNGVNVFSPKFQKSKKLFDLNEIETIAEAAEDHRASGKSAPRSIYGMLSISLGDISFFGNPAFLKFGIEDTI